MHSREHRQACPGMHKPRGPVPCACGHLALPPPRPPPRHAPLLTPCTAFLSRRETAWA